MARYIIRCSNIYRNYNLDSDLHNEYTIFKATNTNTLEEALQSYTDNGKPIIIAVIENIIESSIKTATSESESREMGRKAIEKTIGMIKKYEKNYKESIVAMVKPIGSEVLVVQEMIEVMD